MTRKKTIEDYYQDMHKLTFSKCSSMCVRKSYSCCSPYYCKLAMENAAKEGVYLPPAKHSHLPLLGEKGCIAQPHFRPICTIHICERFLWQDPAFRRKYFKLRDKLNDMEAERMKKLPGTLTVLALDPKATHASNPDCPMRLAPLPGDKSGYYCVDCGRQIILKKICVKEDDND